VKELRKGLTITDKFVLLILAEYHRTDEKMAWPSVETLAEDCLMTKRGVLYVLARLESGDFVRRVKGGGRGVRTAYQIVGVDCVKSEPVSVNTETLNTYSVNETVNGGSVNSERNSERGFSCNKEEPVKEPVKESNRVEIIPPDQPALNYAVRIIEEVGMTDTHSNRVAVEAAVKRQIRDGKSGASAYEFLVAVGLDAKDRGTAVDKFFFEDQKWESVNGKRSVSSAAGRSERSVESITNAIRAHRRNTASPVPG
jgi:hypothetical protein